MSDARFQSLFNSSQLELKRSVSSVGASTIGGSSASGSGSGGVGSPLISPVSGGPPVCSGESVGGGGKTSFVHDDPWGMNTPTQFPPAGRELSSSSSASSSASVAVAGHPYLTPPLSERKEPLWPAATAGATGVLGSVIAGPQQPVNSQHQQPLAGCATGPPGASTCGVPLTPSASGGAPGSATPAAPHDASHDLPLELLNQGWRKFFSKRENRFYFFNKITNDSLWEMPPLPGASAGYDPLTDPLGISGPSTELLPPTPPHHTGSPLHHGAHPLHMSSPGGPVGQSHHHHPQHPHHHHSQHHHHHLHQQHHGALLHAASGHAQKRHGSASLEVGGPGLESPAKRSSGCGAAGSSGPSGWLNGPFDLEVSSNVMMLERAPSSAPPPLPEIELLRAMMLHRLRQQLAEMCHSREGIECPRDTFIRWLVERKTVDRAGIGSDPVLPSQCTPEISQLMYREIMADIPIRLVKPKSPADARKQLARYAEAAKKMIESRNASSESRKVVKWNVEDAFSWLRRTVNATYDDHADRLNHLRRQCQPHLNQVARTSVEGICSKIYSLSADYAKKIHAKHWQALNAHGIEELTAPLRVANPKRLHCYSVQLALSYPKSLSPCVEICYDTREAYPATMLKYRGEVTRLGTLYFQKLEQLYRLGSVDDRKFEYFLSRVYSMIKRYHSLFSLGQSIDPQCTVHLLYCALPSTVMACLHKHFGVTFEGFASPLNCYFKQYCSPFPDTDGFFGSRGDFLKLQPLCGSIQLHPPDVEELLMETARHVEKLLSQSQEPLSFIIFTQEPISDASEQALNLLQSSRYKREQITLAAFDYELRHGFQHMISRSDILFKPNFSMDIYFLQNDAGYAHWGPTPERIEALRDSFKLGLDAMREESHIPVMLNSSQQVKKAI